MHAPSPSAHNKQHERSEGWCKGLVLKVQDAINNPHSLYRRNSHCQSPLIHDSSTLMKLWKDMITRSSSDPRVWITLTSSFQKYQEIIIILLSVSLTSFFWHNNFDFSIDLHVLFSTLLLCVLLVSPWNLSNAFCIWSQFFLFYTLALKCLIAYSETFGEMNIEHTEMLMPPAEHLTTMQHNPIQMELPPRYNIGDRLPWDF